jgi:hypothetical protein
MLFLVSSVSPFGVFQARYLIVVLLFFQKRPHLNLRFNSVSLLGYPGDLEVPQRLSVLLLFAFLLLLLLLLLPLPVLGAVGTVRGFRQNVLEWYRALKNNIKTFFFFFII